MGGLPQEFTIQYFWYNSMIIIFRFIGWLLSFYLPENFI